MGRRLGWLALGAVGLLALAACERGASAPSRAQRDEGSRSGASSSAGEAAPRDGERAYGGANASGGGGYASSDRGGRDKPREETPLFHGKPLWADNRRHTAKENADYQCDKHGSDIASKGLDDCLTKVHAFVDNPPSGAEVITRVRNGDKLLYDAKSNMFAVARKDGAPRTFFKPRDGADYWRQQKDEAQSGRSARRRSGADDEAAQRGN